MKKILTSAIILCAFTACGQIPYKVTVPVPQAPDGTMAYMTNYDTGEIVDSAMVKAEKALFTGDVDEPFIVRFVADGKRYGTSIIEQGSSTINQETKLGVGSMLNDKMMEIVTQLNATAEKLETAQSEEEAMQLYQNYLDAERQAIIDNLDNPIGYFLFIDYANSIPVDEMTAFVEKYPDLKSYKRVKSMVEDSKKVINTSEGHKYADFEVTYNGKTSRLSEYVGDGHYLLVDFWASWCGPCRKEIATIKELYNEYKDKGLQVLGVAVWDKPADTEMAIKQLGITWPCIIDAQTIPTDIYGIRGIPCILLIGPDGTILSRGKQGAALKADVEKVFADK